MCYNTPSFTCNVVEVVETVEIQAAGFFVQQVWTLSPLGGLPEDVPAAYPIVGSGTGLKTGICHLGVKTNISTKYEQVGQVRATSLTLILTSVLSVNTVAPLSLFKPSLSLYFIIFHNCICDLK